MKNCTCYWCGIMTEELTPFKDKDIMICNRCYEQYNTGKDIVEIKVLSQGLYNQVIREELDPVIAREQLKLFCCEQLNLREAPLLTVINPVGKNTNGVFLCH